MPFIPNTPESHAAVLSPSSTIICCGVSNDGKPCKRALVRDASGEPQSGIITIVAKNQQAYFCTRHQDQAKDVVLRHTASFARRRALIGRGSLDTLIEQVEVLVGDGGGGPTISTTVVSTTKKVAKNKDPFRPVLADNTEEDAIGVAPPRPPSPPSGHHSHGRRKEKKKRRGFLARLLMGCCCIPSSSDEDPDDEKNWSGRRKEAELRAAAAAVVDETFPKQPGHAKKKGDHKVVAFMSVPPTPPLPMLYPPKQHPPSAMAKHAPVPTAQPSKATVVGMGLSPATPQSDSEEEVTPVDVSGLSKEQQALLKLIPKTVHPHGLGRLQQEVLRPFSDKDEPGYIYMFWLTDSPLSPFSTPSASGSGTPHAPRTNHSNSDHLLRAALNTAPTPGGTRPKLLLKIGRAANVQRRLHQWTSQCGYNLALIRYYPHTSASSPGVGTEVARQVPNSHRIERLIHLELSAAPGANPKKDCEACGKIHKEWFEVEASREGILAVDEVIKRWIAFGERSVGVKGVPNPPKPPMLQQSRPKKSAATATAAATAPGGVKMYEKKTKEGSSSTATKTTANGKGKGKASAQTTPKKKRPGPRKNKRNDDDDDYNDDDDEDEDEDSD